MITMTSIQDFLKQTHIALAGVSRKKGKFGNTIFSVLSGKGYTIYPVNPYLDEFEGRKCYHDIASLPDEVTGIIINTKEDVTKELVAEAGKKGINHIWLQQGAISKEAMNDSWIYQGNTITGHCILMFAAPVQGIHGFHRWLKKSFGKFPN